MKRTISWILALLTILVMLASCGDATTSSTVPTESETELTGESTASETETTPDAPTSPEVPTTETPTETPEEPLPSSYTLIGTKHLPIVDNQGSIGSCTSEGVTFTQFTVAVSQYMNAHYPEIEWDPSSGNPEYIFSPKFTYNYSTGSTAMCYNVLLSDGCLPMSVSVFDKNKSSDKNFFGGSILNSQKTRSWDVAEGQMLQALKYRLNNYEEIESGGKLLSATGDSVLLTKIKRAVSQGNAVAVCGSSSYWTYSRFDVDGDIAKKGESVIWSSRHRVENPGDGGGHCVAIIGYDDNATLTIGGVTMKGAFLVRNSWGNWMNGGNVWMMYDACDSTSIYSLFNSKEFCSAIPTLAIERNNFANSQSSTSNILLDFTKVETAEIMGAEYPVYTICDSATGIYLAYNKNGTLRSNTKRADALCKFALIPFADLQKGSDDYASSYALYAIDTETDLKYLHMAYSSGGNASLVADCSDITTTFFNLGSKSKVDENGNFSAMVCKVIDSSSAYTREATIYSYGFVYWDKDISVGMPKLSVEVNVEMIDRSVIYMTLTRTDKNGVTESCTSGMMENRYENGAVPDIGIQGSRTSFSGIIDPTKREDGWLAFGYMPLTNFGKDVSYENFLWGVTVKGSNTLIKELRLVDENGNILCSVKPDKNSELLKLGETQYFSFDLAAEKKIYFGTGAYKFKNVGTGEILSLASNNMTFEAAGKNPALDKVTFKLKYDQTKESYLIWNNKETYVLDVKGGKAEDGTPGQLNAYKTTKTTQNWTITQDENGYLRIALQSDPSLCFGASGKTFGIFKDNKSDNFLWMPVPAEEVNMPISIEEQKDGKVTFTLHKPFDYKSGTVTVKIVKDGEVVKTIEETPTDAGKELSVELEKGSYLFTVMMDGKCTGYQIAYIVK